MADKDISLQQNQTIGQTFSEVRSDGLCGWRVVSRDIDVVVVPEFLPERSSAEQHFYSYAYHVTVSNLTNRAVQLVGRTWVITDGTGYIETVEGDGVVGEQPWLKPNESFSYSSGCPLRTPTGNMRGWYHFKTEDGSHFSSRIPLFFLRTDSLRH